MTTEQKLHDVTHDIVRRLEIEVLNYISYQPSREKLRQIALDILNTDKAWQQFAIEEKAKNPTTLPAIPEPDKPTYEN